MSRTATLEAAWNERCSELEAFGAEHGRRPRRSDTASESTRPLVNWFETNRRAHGLGTLSASRAERFTPFLDAFPPGKQGHPVGSLGRPNQGRLHKLEHLAAFVSANDRLPKISSAEADEHALAKFLIHSLRPSIRGGTIHAASLAIAQQIPGAVNITPRPDQSNRLAALQRFAKTQGHLPRNGRPASEEEIQLGDWLTCNTVRRTAKPSPALRKRYAAVDALIAAYPYASQKRALDRVAELEEFIATTGHLPTLSDGTQPDQRQERSLASWMRATGKGNLSPDGEARLELALCSPSKQAVLWTQKLEELRTATAGRPITKEDRIYGWRQSQRYRHHIGALPQWQVDLLLETPGALLRRESPAVAA